MIALDPSTLNLSAKAEDALNAALDHLGRDATAFAVVTWIDDRIAKRATQDIQLWALQDLRAVLVVAALMHVRIGQEAR